MLTSYSADDSLEPAPLSQDNGEQDDARRERIAAEVQDNCDVLQHKLTAFESAWHIVRLACSKLSSDLALAKTFTTVSNAAHAPRHSLGEPPSRICLLFSHHTLLHLRFATIVGLISARCAPLTFMTLVQCYPPVPQAVDTNLRAAALVHTPLVDCLNAYSIGKSPEFL